MTRPLALVLALALFTPACAGEFGSVGRSTKVSDGSRITASNIVPKDPELRGVTEELALAEEIYSKQLDNLRSRRDTLRTRRRALTLGSFATLAATTLVISAAAINSSSDAMTSHDGLKTAGYGALGGLGLGTTLEVVNLMQEDPSAIDAKIRNLQASYDTMVDRLRDVFAGGKEAPNVELRAMPIIEQFINEALQISVKG